MTQSREFLREQADRLLMDRYGHTVREGFVSQRSLPIAYAGWVKRTVVDLAEVPTRGDGRPSTSPDA